MDYKYYTAIVCNSVAEAETLSRLYHHLPEGADEADYTLYRFPVTTTLEGLPCVVVYTLNDLIESDIARVSIEKVNAAFITLNSI